LSVKSYKALTTS